MLDFPNSPTVGDVFDSKWRWDGEKWISTSSVSTPYLPIAGGTMLGPITLSGWATANLHAVPLQQVVSRLQSYLPLTGGTLSGSLNVTGNVVATALVQGATVNATGDLTAGGNIGTNNVVYAGAVQSGAFYGNPTFTGSITVNGNISTSNGVYAAVVQAPTYAGSVTVTGSLQVNGNIGCSNTIFATGAVQTPQLNGNVYVTGNLNSAGQVQGNSLYARDRVDAGGGIFAGNLIQSNRGDDLAFYAPYGGVTIATAFVSNRGGGQLAFYAPNGADAWIGGNITGNGIYGNYVRSWGDLAVSNTTYTGYLNASSNISAGNDVTAGGTLVSNHGVVAYGDWTFGIGQSGTERALSFAGGWWQFIWNTTNGWLTWMNPGSQINYVWGADGFCYSNLGPSGGRGEYVNFSDIRFKDATTITPTTKGLSEILLLNPVEFKRLPVEVEPPPEGEIPPQVPPPILELGFIAQEVASVLPEAVNILGVTLPDGTGGRDTEDPTLGVTAGAITAVLVNAVKELNTTLMDVNTRLAALEGA